MKDATHSPAPAPPLAMQGGKLPQAGEVLHRQQLAIGQLQGAAALQRFERRAGKLVQRGLVDAQQAAQLLCAGIGLQAQRPGLDQPVLLQQGAGGGGVLAAGLELLEELQHLGGAGGRLALVVEEGLAVAGAHEVAAGVDAQHLLAVLGAGQAEGVAAVGRRDVAGQPAAVRRHIQVAAGLQALDGDGQQAGHVRRGLVDTGGDVARCTLAVALLLGVALRGLSGGRDTVSGCVVGALLQHLQHHAARRLQQGRLGTIRLRHERIVDSNKRQTARRAVSLLHAQ